MQQRAAGQRRSSGLLDPHPFRRSSWSSLSALFDEDHMPVRTITVDAVTEAPQRHRVADGLCPLAFIRHDHTLRMRFAFGGDTELILARHWFEIGEPSVESVAPRGRAW